MYSLSTGNLLEMRPVSEAEISMVNSRDFNGGYPYVNLFAADHRNSLDTQCFLVEDQIAAYGLAGVADHEGKRIGEIGMVHVSPAVRGLGLGSLMSLILRERLLLQQPDELVTKIGDNSGKVEHFVKQIGYTFTGMIEGAGRHPVWARNFSSNEERESFGAVLNGMIDERLEKLCEKSDVLGLKARSLDKDNPSTTDVEKVVDERLKELAVSDPSDGITYFGFVGAPVRIARSVANGTIGYSVMLDLKDIDPGHVSQLLEENEEGFKISTFEGYQQGSTPTVRVSTPLTHNTRQLNSYTRKFATIAASLYGE